MSTTEQDQGIKIPRWAMAIVLTLLLQTLAIVYGAGTVVNRVEQLEKRIDVLENRFHRWIELNAARTNQSGS